MKCDPETNNYLIFDQQYNPSTYETEAPPLNFSSAPPANPHPPISEFLSSTQLPSDATSYPLPRSEDPFSEKYANNGTDYLVDNEYDDQFISSLSDPSFDYTMPSTSGTQSFSSSSYPANSVEEEHYRELENQSFRPFVQDTRPTIYSYGSLAPQVPQALPPKQNLSESIECYRTDNQNYTGLEYPTTDTPGSRKRKLDESHASTTSVKSRVVSNAQLNPNAVAIMDEWYRSHLDKPYPNKEEKLRMALAGDITETQVNSEVL